LTEEGATVLVIYYCYGGTHSSPVAAALHTGLLPAERIPTRKELLQLPWFDRIQTDQRGQLFFVGKDQAGNAIYICGRGKERDGIAQAIKSGFSLSGGDSQELFFVDTMPAVNLVMRVGGYLSRRLGLVALGRPLAILGAQLAFPQLLRIVQAAKGELAQIQGDGEPR
jgi:hypothetical protein